MFRRAVSGQSAEEITTTGLMALIDGIDIIRARQRKRNTLAA